MKPVRIQRKRTKGWKMPENTVAVTRPTFFGNPFFIGGWHNIGPGRRGAFDAGYSRISCYHEKDAGPGYEDCGDNAKAVELYKRYLELYPLAEDKKAQLCGKNLACWCPLDQPCHADILLQLVNGDCHD
jgi:hypothetical protein